VPAHRQPAYAHLGYGPSSLPATEAAAARVLSLPMYPDLPEAAVNTVAAAVRSYFETAN